MSVFIPVPERDPRGPDGQGWNRLSLNAGPVSYGQCALKPRSYPALWETLNRPPHFGGYGPCTRRERDCRNCPVYNLPPTRLESFTPRVLFRIRPVHREVKPGHLMVAPPVDELHLMNHPEKGWASSSRVWTWNELVRLQGWELDGYHHDDDGDGFWMRCTHDRPEHTEEHLIRLIESI